MLLCAPYSFLTWKSVKREHLSLTSLSVKMVKYVYVCLSCPRCVCGGGGGKGERNGENLSMSKIKI